MQLLGKALSLFSLALLASAGNVPLPAYPLVRMIDPQHKTVTQSPELPRN